jgi:hypothetical protein
MAVLLLFALLLELPPTRATIDSFLLLDGVVSNQCDTKQYEGTKYGLWAYLTIGQIQWPNGPVYLLHMTQRCMNL